MVDVAVLKEMSYIMDKTDSITFNDNNIIHMYDLKAISGQMLSMHFLDLRFQK